MQKDNQSLIEELLSITESASKAVEKFKALPVGQLNFKEHPERWSALECIEHLNRYNDYYLPEIRKALSLEKRHGPARLYKSGLIGNYFAGIMKVSDGRVFKMRTPSDKNPAGSQLSISTLDRFLEQQEVLKSLLHRAREADLTRTKVPLSINRFIRFNLGDTLRFFIYHIERHILQAERALKYRDPEQAEP